MKVLVTGFEGYVGSHAVIALRASGVEISVLTRDAGSAERAEAAGLTPISGSLELPETLAKATASVDSVAHFAASDRPDFLPVNIAAIDAMIGALKPGGVFLTHGGTMVFGEQGRDRPARDPRFAPPPPLSARAELDSTILQRARDGKRTFVVYGAFVFGGRGAMIPSTLASAAVQNGFSGYPGDGNAVWSGVHVEDWGDLMARVVVSDDPGGRPVVAAGQNVVIAAAAQTLAQTMVPPVSTRSVSIDEARRLWPFFADGLALYQRFDPTDAEERFAWKPDPRPLNLGFSDALSSVR